MQDTVTVKELWIDLHLNVQIETHTATTDTFDNSVEIISDKKLTIMPSTKFDFRVLGTPIHMMEESTGILSYEVGDIGRVRLKTKSESKEATQFLTGMLTLTEEDELAKEKLIWAAINKTKELREKAEMRVKEMSEQEESLSQMLHRVY